MLDVPIQDFKINSMISQAKFDKRTEVENGKTRMLI